MLKPVDPPVGERHAGGRPTGERPGEERPVGELIHQLVEDGKAYARAEIALVKAIATAKASALVLPAAMFGAAFVCLLAGVTALALGIVLGLAKFIGPVAAGIVGLLIFALVAGGLAWFGARRLKDMP